MNDYVSRKTGQGTNYVALKMEYNFPEKYTSSNNQLIAPAILNRLFSGNLTC